MAAAAGVSVPTASKVLAGGDVRCRAETRERIKRTAESLGYRPNPVARSLRLRHPGAIGLIVPSFANPSIGVVARGASQRAAELGIALVTAEHVDDAARAVYRRLLRDNRLEGLLVASASAASRLVDDLEADRLPYVLVNRTLSGRGPSVRMDDRAGIRLAVTALTDYGHRRIGLISGPPDVDTSVRRRRAFDEIVGELGLPGAVVEPSDYTAAGGASAMTRMVAARPRVTGVIAANFLTAMGALSGAAESDVAVPRDVSVVSFEDAELGQYLVPSLTAISMPLRRMGAVSVDALMSTIESGAQPEITLDDPPRLVVRHSLAPPAHHP